MGIQYTFWVLISKKKHKFWEFKIEACHIFTGVWSQVWLHAEVGELLWERAWRWKERPGDTIRDMKVYWNSHRKSGSRWLDKVAYCYCGREGNCSYGGGGKDYVCTKEDMRFMTILHVMLEGIILVQPVPQGMKPVNTRCCLPIRCLHW